MFDNVDGEFDVIVFDPPFRWFAARDMLELAFADEDYRTLGRFMAEVGDRLSAGGEVLLFFGSSGDVAHLEELVERAGFRIETLAERTIQVRGADAAYFVRRLSKQQPA